MQNKIKAAGALLALVAGFFVMTNVVSADQPKMKDARTNLNKALNYLQKATADKGGHRNKAIDETRKAIKNVNDGIEYDRTHRSAEFDPEFLTQIGAAAADQPNMVKARTYLQKALNNLEAATDDKGGYRVKALANVREAIEQTNKGIAYDNRN